MIACTERLPPELKERARLAIVNLEATERRFREHPDDPEAGEAREQACEEGRGVHAMLGEFNC